MAGQTASGVASLTAELRAAGSRERAEGSRRYLKSDRRHLGVAVPSTRAIARAYAAAHPGLGHDELSDLVRALWATEIHDCCLVAVLLTGAYPSLVTSADLLLLRGLAADARTWALLDPLATETLGELVMRDAAAADGIDGWIGEESVWVRRAALLSQLRPATRRGEYARFLRYADALLDEREFFIAKAIGWGLREIGKRDPQAVSTWLAPRIGRASGVTVREALKPLPENERDALRAARAGSEEGSQKAPRAPGGRPRTPGCRR